MTTVAYIANEFPSPLEPYVMDEVTELRCRGIDVVCCSGKRAPAPLSPAERAFWKETRFFQPLTNEQLLAAVRRLTRERRVLWRIVPPVFSDRHASPLRRLRALGHTLMGAAMAEQLAPLGVDHIHAHHGYFASWMARVAAELLGVGFSFTLHGSDLLRRADFLAAKLRACRFCVTISDYNREYILRNYPSTAPEKVTVHRLGVNRVPPQAKYQQAVARYGRRFCLLSVGRLHRVKDHCFLVRACAALRDEGMDFICWIAGEGPERAALERMILANGLQGRVYLVGHVPRPELASYYQHADLVVLTSRSEGIPVVLMEAMAHEQLVLAPAITGIPELVEHGHTGFLYEPGSLGNFVSAVRWIEARQAAFEHVRRAAGASVESFFNRQQNLRNFADDFLARISQPEGGHAHPVLQQVRLSV